MSTLRPEASVGFAGLVEDMEREIVSRLDRPSRFVFAYTTRAYYALYRGVRAKELYTEDPYNVGDTFMDALIAGHLSVMEWCLSFVFNPSVENVIKANIMYSAEALRKDRFDVLKFLHKLGFAITADCIGDAAAHENIEIMQWALDSGVGKVSADITGQGVTSGNMEVVKWLLDHGSPVDLFLLRQAPSSGSIDMVRFVFEKVGYPPSRRVGIAKHALEAAVGSKSTVEIFNFYYDLGFPMSPSLFLFACKGGNLPIVKRLLELNLFDPQLHHRSLWEAASSSSLETVEYLIAELGFKLHANELESAMLSQNPKILDYYLENLNDLPEDLISMFLSNTRLPDDLIIERLKNLLGRGFSLVDCGPAVLERHSLTILKFLISVGLPVTETFFKNSVVQWNSFSIISYLLNTFKFQLDEEILEAACGAGCIKLIELAHKQGMRATPSMIVITFQECYDSEKIKVLELLLKMGADLTQSGADLTQAAEAAVYHDDVLLLDWMWEHGFQFHPDEVFIQEMLEMYQPGDKYTVFQWLNRKGLASGVPPSYLADPSETSESSEGPPIDETRTEREEARLECGLTAEKEPPEWVAAELKERQQSLSERFGQGHQRGGRGRGKGGRVRYNSH